MVFSSGSLSLLDFPLDIRAAMENALARDESCGFGDDVYSISGRGGENRTKNKSSEGKRASRNPSEAPPAEGNPADVSCAPRLKRKLVEV